jgi:hypothetical protein
MSCTTHQLVSYSSKFCRKAPMSHVGKENSCILVLNILLRITGTHIKSVMDRQMGNIPSPKKAYSVIASDMCHNQPHSLLRFPWNNTKNAHLNHLNHLNPKNAHIINSLSQQFSPTHTSYPQRRLQILPLLCFPFYNNVRPYATSLG